jgi:tetratricopeptide (TPR) repeat protein
MKRAVLILLLLALASMLFSQVTSDRNAWWSYKAMGDRYFEKGQYEDALWSYERAVYIRPDCAMCYYKLAEVFVEMQLFDDALYEVNLALEFSEDFYDTYEEALAWLLKAEILYLLDRDRNLYEVASILKDRIIREYLNGNYRYHAIPEIFGRAALALGIIYWYNMRRGEAVIHLRDDEYMPILIWQQQQPVDRVIHFTFDVALKLGYKEAFANFFIADYLQRFHVPKNLSYNEIATMKFDFDDIFHPSDIDSLLVDQEVKYYLRRSLEINEHAAQIINNTPWDQVNIFREWWN